jgi:hypothetical protein
VCQPGLESSQRRLKQIMSNNLPTVRTIKVLISLSILLIKTHFSITQSLFCFILQGKLPSAPSFLFVFSACRDEGGRLRFIGWKKWGVHFLRSLLYAVSTRANRDMGLIKRGVWLGVCTVRVCALGGGYDTIDINSFNMGG